MSTNLNLKQLEAFVWVADLGSFRKAAERLNTTQPNISARISSLENTLDVKLMERDAGSVRLTAKGAQLLSQARAVLHATEQLIEMADHATLVEGVLKLGVTEMIVNTWLRDFLKAVKETYPNLHVELMVDLSDNLRPQLFSRALDMAFQNGPFARTTSGSADLGTYPFIWVASPDLDIQPAKPLTIQEMKQHPLLTHVRGTKPFEEIEAHFVKSAGAKPSIIPSSNIAPCLHMALDGLGVACLPAAMVKRHVDRGRLLPVAYPWTPEPLHFLARYDAQTASLFVGKVAKIAAEIAASYPKTL